MFKDYATIEFQVSYIPVAAECKHFTNAVR